MGDAKKGAFGLGWKFPPAFDPRTGVAMVHDLDDIEESLRILFQTQPGERLLHPDYGCDLQSFLFENIDDDLFAALKTRITDSMLRYEKRVEPMSVNIELDRDVPGCLRVRVIYRIRGSQIVRQLDGRLGTGDGTGAQF
ncbi:phage baseplate protein [Burkholderia sp. Bp9126]|nr:phage baseplate protein [Burkholderia sp. Bp9126]